MQKFVSLALTVSLVTGCATPAGMVSKRDVSASEVKTMTELPCADLQERYETAIKHEAQLASAMNKRAGAQLAANAIGIAAIAFGGIGFLYTVRNEGDNRSALSNVRGELEVMKLAATDAKCDLDVVAQKIADAAKAEPIKTEAVNPK
jgi:hypothetical protein